MRIRTIIIDMCENAHYNIGSISNQYEFIFEKNKKSKGKIMEERDNVCKCLKCLFFVELYKGDVLNPNGKIMGIVII